MKQTKNEYYYALIEKLVESITIEHHAVCEHDNKTDAVLKTRCSIEKKNSSCFNFDKKEVIELITDAIYDDITLLAWIKSNVKDDYVITTTYENCGRKYIKSGTHIWKNGSLQCDQFRIILGKKHDLSGAVIQVYLKSAYPV